jgi:hypothetical protein
MNDHVRLKLIGRTHRLAATEEVFGIVHSDNVDIPIWIRRFVSSKREPL